MNLPDDRWRITHAHPMPAWMMALAILYPIALLIGAALLVAWLNRRPR